MPRVLNSYFVLFLQYCSGGELFEYLVARKQLNEWEAKKIFKQLVQVLGYVHSKGFAHRDIKPENILIDDQGNIKLIDFGLAANSQTKPSGLNMLSTWCGSPAYVAPELLKNELYYGPAVDVWSSGVVLYALLAGKLPFSDSNNSQMYKLIKVSYFFHFLSIHFSHFFRVEFMRCPFFSRAKFKI